MNATLVIVAVEADHAGVVVLGPAYGGRRPVLETRDLELAELAPVVRGLASWHGQQRALWACASTGEAEIVRTLCAADGEGRLYGAGAAALEPLGKVLRQAADCVPRGRPALQRARACAVHLKLHARWNWRSQPEGETE